MSHDWNVFLLTVAFILFVVGCLVDIWPQKRLPGAVAFLAAGMALVDFVFLKSV